jgi:hypothetical protein
MKKAVLYKVLSESSQTVIVVTASVKEDEKGAASTCDSPCETTSHHILC